MTREQILASGSITGRAIMFRYIGLATKWLRICHYHLTYHLLLLKITT